MSRSSEELTPPPEHTSAEAFRAMRLALKQQLVPPSEETEPATPLFVPDHVLLHRIGWGAYGEVWLARSALGTLRAVKTVYRARFKEDRPYEREFNGILKYEPISRTHEGLVQVLHVGRNDDRGYFFYVMELAEAAGGSNSTSPAPSSGSPRPLANPASYTPRTLRSELKHRQRFPPPEAASLVVRLLGALGHLHRHALIHRDIKPSNVIFVSGQPKLADIGLVTDVGSSQSFVGTEGFIPPEGPGTPQADLYAVGKLLYELATGRDRLDFPQLPPPAADRPEGEALLELNEVMTRACAPNPAQRYQRALEFEADLNLFLAGRSLRRARNIERALTRLKRFAVATCMLLAAAAAAVLLAKNEERHAKQREHLARENANTESALRRLAENAERDSRAQLYSALVGEARATVRSGELGHRVRALDSLRRAAAISNTVELRREVFAALALPDLRLERELPIDTEVKFTQLDPTFERLALFRGTAPVEIRSVSDYRLLIALPASTNLRANFGLWSPDGRFLAIKRDQDRAGHRADVEVWEVASVRRALLLRGVLGNAMSFHPRLSQIMAGFPGGTVAVWNLADGNELTRFALPIEPLELKYSPDGNRFASSGDHQARGVVSVHHAADAAPLASHVIPGGVSAVDWHPSGRWIAAGGDDSSVNLINSQTGESRTLGRHKANAAYMQFTPDGRYLFSGGWERELICWDLQSMQRAFTMALDSFHIQFRSDGSACAVIAPMKVQLHALELPASHREFAEDLGTRLRDAAFSADGRWLAASAGDFLGVWDLTGLGPGALASEGAEARPFFMPDGLELFGSRSDNDCVRWRIVPGLNAGAPPQLERVKLDKPEGFTSLCLISNVVVMTGSRGTQLMTPDSATAADVPWTRTSSGITRVSPDGRWFGVYRSFTPSLDVYRLPGLDRVASLTHPANIGDFKFSPSGDELAIASLGQMETWNTSTWERTRVFNNFMRILYAPDDRTWWLNIDFLTAGLYDRRGVKPLLPLPRGILPLALSQDGRHLAVSVDARRLQVWDLTQVREQFRRLGIDWEVTDN